MATQIEQMTEKSLALKNWMNRIESQSPEVQKYLRLQERRKKLHRDMAKHIHRYGVNPDKYKGLVAYEAESISIKKLKKLLSEQEFNSPQEVVENVLGMIRKHWRAYTR